MKTFACIDDLRREAYRKVPRDVMDYYDSGSYAEATLAANRADLSRITLRQRVLADAASRTLDTQIIGTPKATSRWALSVLGGKRKTFGNLTDRVAGMDGATSLAKWNETQFDQALSWKDVDWVRSLWPGKLNLKGIPDVEDARLAAKSGATALVVSNHGGRQLDGAPSSISMLPKIADAVG